MTIDDVRTTACTSEHVRIDIANVSPQQDTAFDQATAETPDCCVVFDVRHHRKSCRTRSSASRIANGHAACCDDEMVVEELAGLVRCLTVIPSH